MNYKNIKDLFNDVDRLKKIVTQLRRNELRLFKLEFYLLPFPTWELNLIWEYFWDDITYYEVYLVFYSKNLL